MSSEATRAYEAAELVVAKERQDGRKVLDLAQPDCAGLTRLPEALGGLPALRQLTLGSSSRALQLTDLSPIAGLTDLTELNLRGVPVVDLWPLSGLGALRRLDLERTPVSDLSPLAGLAQLQELYLDRMPFLRDLGPVSEIETLRALWINDSAVRDIRPLRRLSKLRDAPHGNSLRLEGCAAADRDPRLAEIANLARNRARVEAVFDYIDTLPAWPRPLPSPPYPAEDARESTEEAPDRLFPVEPVAARMEVAASLPTEAEREERLKRLLFEQLREMADSLALAAGNRFSRLARRARALRDRLDCEFDAVDLLSLHLALEDLQTLSDLGCEDAESGEFPPEVRAPLAGVLNRGPGLTLGNADVDLLVERANRRRTDPADPLDDDRAQDAMSAAVAEDAATMGIRLRRLETAVLTSRSAEAKVSQRAINRNVLWKMAVWSSSLGTGVAAGVVANTYGVDIVQFVTSTWAVLVDAAATYGPRFAAWFTASVARVTEFAGLAADAPPPPEADGAKRGDSE